MQYSREPAATRDDYERAFEGIEFPIAHEALLRAVHDRGGIDREVIDILTALPEDADLHSLDDLLEAVRAVYAARDTKSPI